MYNLLKNKRLILTLPLFLAASLLLPVYIVPLGHASPGTGLVCITTSTLATTCPTSAPTIGPLTAGTVFTVGVFIQGSDAMGGFDIYVASDNAFVHPTSAALGNLIANPSLTSICINGIATVGSCTAVASPNGPGVVEVTTAESSGGDECGGISPCSGMAFTITYQVVGTGPDTSLSYPAGFGACATSSVASPPSTCVLVDDHLGSTLSENIQGATVSAPVVSLTGKVCPVYPATMTSCPTSPFSFPPGNTTVGTHNLIVGVFVQNSQPLGGFDIYVAANSTYLHPENATLGNLIASPSLTTRCVNAVSLEGQCTVNSANGPGVVEVSTVDSTGLNSTTCGTTSCSGLAFTINYTVVGKIPSTPTFYPRPSPGNELACLLNGSVGTTDICVIILASNGNTLPENVQVANVEQTVINDPTSTGLICVPNPVVVGDSTTCTATVRDTASSGATSPLGSVAFFGSDGSFSGGSSPGFCLVSPGLGNPNTCSVVYTPSHVDTGTHTIDCTYSGDPGVHRGSFCNTFLLTVSKATPSISTGVINDQTGQPAGASVPVGTSVHDAALLIGGFPITGVSGTVTYTLYPNSKCTAGTGTVVTIRNVGASNNVLGSGSVTPANTGGTALPYSFNAMYNGDSDNAAVTSACEQFTVLPAPQFAGAKLHWTHHLSLAKSANTQTWTAIVSNSFTTSVNVVVRIVGSSAINPMLNFDVTCGVTCVNTDPGGVNSTPGLTPVSVPAGSSSFSFNFNQPISPSFANNKFSFTATVYWTLGTVYTPSSTKSGAFAVVS